MGHIIPAVIRSLLFGPGGVLPSASGHSTMDGVNRVAELHLGCMEVEFVQGVKMSDETAKMVGALAAAKGVALSAHGPYAINLNSRDRDKVNASKERILKTARVAARLGARSIVFHPAFLSGDPPALAMKRVRDAISDVRAVLQAEENKVWLRPEVTGKVSQFGTLEELVEISAEIDGVMPCIDFAHWHARSGKYNSYREFVSMLNLVEKGLGRKGLEDIHIHVSGIAYSRYGEIKHLELRKSDFNFKDLMKALKDKQVKGLVICESPREVMESDIRLLQETYDSL